MLICSGSAVVYCASLVMLICSGSAVVYILCEFDHVDLQWVSCSMLY